ncbi:MAG: N-acetylmuramoyl-L-alanine amidase [Okeania sp. SIO2F4]|uniref:N-acetylmuramoyl-L-alanine amidase n=1 Tax=Okeania sp. SIO2F4 TaxID=2607790 RepID=UPI00142C1DDA|nr:N-acetylmuramoyl-L-alanine amidase [Okeania sp. SIO2F4]NES04915.1 N-acetylmuramoyl-L-alanine amidase [Okeania sp. SIO2F4]
MKNIYPGNRLIFLNSTQLGKNLILRCLLPSILSVFVLGSPSEAATLESWQFKVNQNQLSFTTEGGVQPKAQLITNPTRLIIDLPGTTLGGIRTSQVVGGSIKAIRVGQFNSQTARIVVELNNGYTIDPKQVQFRGISPSEWTVQIPTPQKITSTADINVTPQSPPLPPQSLQSSPPPPPRSPLPLGRTERPSNQKSPPLPPQSPQSSPPPPPRSPLPLGRTERPTNQNRPRPDNSSTFNSTATNGTPTLVEDVQIKKEGVVLKTSGKLPEIELKKSVDRTWMTIDVLNATLTAKGLKPNQRFNESGLTITQLTQLSTTPAVVRLTVSLPDTNTQWQARAYAGGVAVWPQGEAPPTINQATGFAVVKSVELKNGTELVVTGDQALNYTSGWDSETDAYGITIYNAKVDDRLQLPGRQVGSPLVWAKIRQEDPETVTILVKPATNVKIAEVTQITAQQLSLPMGWGNIGTAPPGWKPNSTRQSSTLLSPSWKPNPTEQPSSSRPSILSRGNNSSPPNSLPPNSSPQNPSPQNRLPQNSSENFRPRRWPFPWPRRNNRRPNTNNRYPRFPLPNRLPRRDGRLMIVIDPGHGGPTDLGGVGIGGLREKDIVLPMSLEVAQILEQNNIQVVMTRKTDRDLDLPPRSELANRVGADLFVSIHANAISMSRPDVNGLETFYYQSGRSLAQYIQNSMLEAFPTMNNRGVKRARFHVLRHTKMPAVLVEVGFVTGNYDSRILADPGQRSRMAQAIARGILRYVQAYSR